MDRVALPCKGIVIDDEGLWILLDASKVTQEERDFISNYKVKRIGIVDCKGEI